VPPAGAGVASLALGVGAGAAPLPLSLLPHPATTNPNIATARVAIKIFFMFLSTSPSGQTNFGTLLRRQGAGTLPDTTSRFNPTFWIFDYLNTEPRHSNCINRWALETSSNPQKARETDLLREETVFDDRDSILFC